MTSGDDTLPDRYRGALLGTALGDALGAPFEGQRRVDAQEVRRWAASAGALRWTDDTAMTIAVAESLVVCGGLDPADMARRFAEHHAAEPWRGYGAGPPQVFAALRDGAAWDEPAAALFEGEGSYGNGAAMRVAPIGVAAHRDPRTAAAIARTSARITHAHPRGQDGAAVQAHAVAWLTAATPRSDGIAVLGLLDEVAAVATTPEMRDKLRALPGLLSGSPGEAVARLGTGLPADEAVPAALYAFVTHPGSLPDAVLSAIGLGGDTDTIGAMAGALAGAVHGTRSIPRAWIGRLEASGRLTQLADRLAAVSLSAPPPDP